MTLVEPKHYPALCLCGQGQIVRLCYDDKQTNAAAQVARQGYVSMSACEWCELRAQVSA